MYIERKGKESLFLEYKNSRKESLKRRRPLIPGSSRGCSDSESEELSASRKKMKFECSADDSFSDLSESGDEKMHQGQGYRLIDLGRFSSTLSEAHVCEEGERCF